MVFWEVLLSVIVRKVVQINVCLILNGYRHRAIVMYKCKSTVNCNKEREVT